MSTITKPTNNFQIQLRREVAKAGKFIYVGLPSSKHTIRVLNKSGYWQLVDFNGKPLTKELETLHPFCDERAQVNDGRLQFNSKSYFIDEEGNRISSPDLEAYSHYSEGLAIVTTKSLIWTKMEIWLCLIGSIMLVAFQIQ